MNITKFISENKIDFIDIGSSKGGSLDFCTRKFSANRGIGIDLSDQKVQFARSKGFTIFNLDASKLKLEENCVRFVSMMDFLEHLPNIEVARRIIDNSIKWASDFVFIRHPSFEMIEYLAARDLKVTWTDWTGHKNKMSINDFEKILGSLCIKDYKILPKKQVLDSTEDCILPISSGSDIVKYDETKHGSKDFVQFEQEIYKQYDIFINIGMKKSDFKSIYNF